MIASGEEVGLYLENLDFSPITGTKGNVEYISLFSLNKQDKREIDIEKCS